MPKKGQIGMEYMTLIVFIFVLLIPLYLLYHTQYEGTNEQIRGNQAEQIARKIIDASESIYYLGEPSKTTIRLYMPTNIENITLQSNEIVFWMRVRNGVDEVVRMSPVNISGSIDSDSGIRYVSLESRGDYVQISSS